MAAPFNTHMQALQDSHSAPVSQTGGMQGKSRALPHGIARYPAASHLTHRPSLGTFPYPAPPSMHAQQMQNQTQVAQQLAQHAQQAWNGSGTAGYDATDNSRYPIHGLYKGNSAENLQRGRGSQDNGMQRAMPMSHTPYSLLGLGGGGSAYGTIGGMRGARSWSEIGAVRQLPVSGRNLENPEVVGNGGDNETYNSHSVGNGDTSNGN